MHTVIRNILGDSGQVVYEVHFVAPGGDRIVHPIEVFCTPRKSLAYAVCSMLNGGFPDVARTAELLRKDLNWKS